jgi:hypothetical protein
MKHCCEDMEFFLGENKVAIGYLPELRFYYIKLKHSTADQGIFYCPWCSKKLADNLFDEYDIELAKALNVDGDDLTKTTFNKNNIPKEFRTDEWWRKRNL